MLRLEDTYANIIMNKVMVDTAKLKKKKYNQSAFKKGVIIFYEAERDSENGRDKRFTMVSFSGIVKISFSFIECQFMRAKQFGGILSALQRTSLTAKD